MYKTRGDDCMRITKYNSLTDTATIKTIRVDYGKSNRLEFAYSFLAQKNDVWQNEDKSKCKLIQHDRILGVSQLGMYIGRVALVAMKGKVGYE